MRTSTCRFAALMLGLATAGLAGTAGTALADAVMPPPTDCAPGSEGRSSHSGPFCAPTQCETDQDCVSTSWRDEGPRICREASLCIGKKMLGGRWKSQETEVPEAVGECRPSCSPPARCETRKRCVPDPNAPPKPDAAPPPPPPPPPRSTRAVATSAAPPTSQPSSGIAMADSEKQSTGCGCSLPPRDRSAAFQASLAVAALGALAARKRRKIRSAPRISA